MLSEGRRTNSLRNEAYRSLSVCIETFLRWLCLSHQPTCPSAQAAHDAAEHLGLPLVLLQQGPLGMILTAAGFNSANMYRWARTHDAQTALPPPAVAAPNQLQRTHASGHAGAVYVPAVFCTPAPACLPVRAHEAQAHSKTSTYRSPCNLTQPHILLHQLLRSHVPLESPGPFLQRERLTLVQRALNPVLKRVVDSHLRGVAVSAPWLVRRSGCKRGAHGCARNFGSRCGVPPRAVRWQCGVPGLFRSLQAHLCWG
jgi:hypothetical protein